MYEDYIRIQVSILIKEAGCAFTLKLNQNLVTTLYLLLATSNYSPTVRCTQISQL